MDDQKPPTDDLKSIGVTNDAAQPEGHAIDRRQFAAGMVTAIGAATLGAATAEATGTGVKSRILERVQADIQANSNRRDGQYVKSGGTYTKEFEITKPPTS
jgi:Na+/glutamate symporter